MRIEPAEFTERQGTVRQADVEATQKAWIRAWITFAAQVDPHFRREAVVNWRPLDRIDELAELVRP